MVGVGDAMKELGRLALLVVMVGMLGMAFVGPAFAKNGGTPCGRSSPDPACPDNSPSNNGGNPGNWDGKGHGGPTSATFSAGGITYGQVFLVVGGMALAYTVVQRRRTRKLVRQS